MGPRACPVATTELATSDGVSIVCPMCGEFELQKLEPDQRGDVLDKARRSAQPGARPVITPYLLASSGRYKRPLTSGCVTASRRTDRSPFGRPGQPDLDRWRWRLLAGRATWLLGHGGSSRLKPSPTFEAY